MSRRKTLWTFGARPHTVTVYTEVIETGDYVRCQWRVRGQRRTQSWPNTPEGRREAKAYGQTLASELRAPTRPAALSLGALWEAYVAAEFESLRPKTQRNYAASWRAWELYAGRETLASSITREGLDGFRRELRRLGIAVNRIRKHFDLVKHVFRFGVDRELLPPTKVTDYRVKVAKEERPLPTAEYRPDDSLQIIGALDPKSSMQWRAWAFCVIAHYLGARANAILHLTWDDVRRSEAEAAVTWRARWDKTGREREQPIPAQVEFALGVAWGWRMTDGYAGPWVFYTSRRAWKGDQPITYGGMNWMLRQAERRAGVAHVHMNAAHRFRRGAAGNVLDLTGGDIQRAMAWIGDEDLAMARRYLKHRDERMHEVAALLSAAPETSNGTAIKQQSAARRSRETTS